MNTKCLVETEETAEVYHNFYIFHFSLIFNEIFNLMCTLYPGAVCTVPIKNGWRVKIDSGMTREVSGRCHEIPSANVPVCD